MKKTLATRILGLAVLYCLVFLILVMLQFPYKGNFTLSTGEMTIKGRYLQAQANSPLYAAEGEESSWQQITGGVKIFYGGLEINLAEGNGKGLVLTGSNGAISSVNPDYMIIEESRALFSLPGGTTVVFNSLETLRGPELQISAQFADGISEVTIPIINRRSSLIRENDQLGILYNNANYFFSNSSRELETSKLVLSREDSLVSYSSRNTENVFDPANYITAQSRDYDNILADWQNSSYSYWNQNASLLQNENDIIAYLSEALRRNQFTSASGSIPRNFVNSSAHTFRSSGYVGGMADAYRSFTSAELEKLNRVTNLTRERSADILMEDHVLDFLLTRSNSALANEALEFVRGIEPETIKIEQCAGLLEMYSDFRKWHPAEVNFIDRFTGQILLLVSENIRHDSENDHVFVSHNESDVIAGDPFFNLRLGKALLAWAEQAGNTEWAEVSRSIVLSALTEGGVGAGNLYAVLNTADYYPKAAWLADNGLWVWTVSPTARASYNADGNLSISVSFPVNNAHYVIIPGVRPFVKIQIHETDWRTDSQFERYDSSGWVYYQQDQILIVKLRHRTTVENIMVYYRVEQPAPTPATPAPAPVPTPTPPTPAPTTAPAVENNSNTETSTFDWRSFLGP